jgi:circadian clock protein KaiB
VSGPDVDPGAAPTLEIYALVLYVVGGGQASRRAVANLRVICDELLKDRYTLEVIDLREFPALAGEQRILAAPTLIKEHPPPTVRLIGDLSERERVLAALDLGPA